MLCAAPGIHDGQSVCTRTPGKRQTAVGDASNRLNLLVGMPDREAGGIPKCHPRADDCRHSPRPTCNHVPVGGGPAHLFLLLVIGLHDVRLRLQCPLPYPLFQAQTGVSKNFSGLGCNRFPGAFPLSPYSRFSPDASIWVSGKLKHNEGNGRKGGKKGGRNAGRKREECKRRENEDCGGGERLVGFGRTFERMKMYSASYFIWSRFFPCCVIQTGTYCN